MDLLRGAFLISPTDNPTMRKKSDGYYHGQITIYLTPVAAVAGGLLFSALNLNPAEGAILAAAGNLFGLFCDPDWDQSILSASEWRIIRVFTIVPLLGHVLAGLVVGYTSAYALLFGLWGSRFRRGSMAALLFKHRGISHWPVVGTLTRLVWVCGPLWALKALVEASNLPQALKVPPLPPEALMALFAGLMVSDMGHLARDLWPSRRPSRWAVGAAK